jgi:hypothetical protein
VDDGDADAVERDLEEEEESLTLDRHQPARAGCAAVPARSVIRREGSDGAEPPRVRCRDRLRRGHRGRDEGLVQYVRQRRTGPRRFGSA